MRFIADNLLTDGPAPQLIGGRHVESGRIVFPCPEGSEGALYNPVALSRRGTLWSYTVQRFAPKSPPYRGFTPFEPFALGYIALPGETIVQARLTGIAFDALRIGMELELAVIPFGTGADGATILTYAFEPAGADAQ